MATPVTLERDPHNDNVYMNILIPAAWPTGIGSTSGVPSNEIPALYNIETRTQPILEDMENYKMSVVSFRVPGEDIPIFVFNANGRQWIISLVIDVMGIPQQFSSMLTWVPESDLPTTSPSYYYCYSYYHFLKILNTSFANAFAALKLAHPTITSTQPPKFYLGDDDKIFFTVQSSYLTDSLHVCVQRDMERFFDGIEVFYHEIAPPFGLSRLELVVANRGNNLVDANFRLDNQNGTLLKMTQAYTSLGNWNDITAVVIISKTLPIRYELIRFLQAGGQGSGQPDFRNQISDFSVATNLGPEYKTGIFYTPSAQYRLIDIIGSGPLRTLDLQFFWQDSFQNIYPIYIPPHTSAFAKILFERYRPKR